MKASLAIIVVLVWGCLAALGNDGRGDVLRVIASDIGGGRALVNWDDGRAGVYVLERDPPFAAGGVRVEGRTFYLDACGEGTFSYRVRREGGDGNGGAGASGWGAVVVVSARAPAADPAVILRGVTIGEDGWAELRPGADSRIVYVSSSTGHDRNDGLSPESPKRTIRAGYAMLRESEPDWLLLKRGDVWEEGELAWGKSGRSPAERMVVASYGGDGDGNEEGWTRPRWLTGKASGIRGDPKGRGSFIANLAFCDLHLVQDGNDGAHGGAGFMLLNGWRDVLIENCRIEGYRVNVLLQAYTEGVRLNGIAIRRCIIVDALATNEAHAQGIFAEGVDGLLMEENVLDRNGWGPDAPTANMFRHNAYIQTRVGDDKGCTNIVTRGNISARASATGFMQRPGGIVEGNLLLQNPIAVQFGYSGGPPVAGTVRGNVVIDGRDIRAGEPRAFGLWLTNVEGVEVAENIVAHQRTGTHNAVAINVDGVYRDVVVRDNIVHDWADGEGDGGAALAWHGSARGGMQVTGNVFRQLRGGGLVGHYSGVGAGGGAGFVYKGNRYSAAKRGRDEFWPGVTYAQWVAQSGETDSVLAPASASDGERTIERYMESIGMKGGIDEFLREARGQARGNWREELTARAVIRWAREGLQADSQ